MEISTLLKDWDTLTVNLERKLFKEDNVRLRNCSLHYNSTTQNYYVVYKGIGYDLNQISLHPIDLRICEEGDILISSHGATLEYVAPTPWGKYSYLDHVVRYVKDANGTPFSKESYGTRTHDGFVFAKNRLPETDHDIVQIIKKKAH